jgi:hypothetical protein
MNLQQQPLLHQVTPVTVNIRVSFLISINLQQQPLLNQVTPVTVNIRVSFLISMNLQQQPLLNQVTPVTFNIYSAIIPNIYESSATTTTEPSNSSYF